MPATTYQAAIAAAVDHPEAVRALADYALVMLWRQEIEGCCPECCGACNALRSLLDAGALIPLLGPMHDDDRANEAGDLDEDWIGQRWATSRCPNHGAPA